MSVHNVGETENFSYYYDDTVDFTPPDTAFKQQRAVDLLNSNACEADLAKLESLFSVSGGFGPNNRIQIIIQRTGAFGENFGYQTGGGTRILVAPFDGNDGNTKQSNERIQATMVAELSEVLMSYRNQLPGANAWNRGDSMGEALSRFSSSLLRPTGYYSLPSSIVAWLDTPFPRKDFVTTTEPTDQHAISYGCGIVFLHYLNTQLSFSLPSIIKASAPTFAGLYSNLTDDLADPYTFFEYLVRVKYPNQSANPTNDNPFPIVQQMQIQCIDKPQAIGTPAYQDFPLLSVSGYNHTLTHHFTFTQKECIALINGGSAVVSGRYNARGNYRFYVSGGGSTADVAVFHHNVPGPDGERTTSYIATNPDRTKADNLLSLPQC